MVLEIHVQALSIEASQMLTSQSTRCDAERNKSSEGHDVTLPRKASSQSSFTRTANRHR